MRLPAQVGTSSAATKQYILIWKLEAHPPLCPFLLFMRFGGRLTFESTYNRVNTVVFSLEEIIVSGMFRVPTLFLGRLFLISQLTLHSQKISSLTIIFVPHAKLLVHFLSKTLHPTKLKQACLSRSLVYVT